MEAVSPSCSATPIICLGQLSYGATNLFGLGGQLRAFRGVVVWMDEAELGAVLGGVVAGGPVVGAASVAVGWIDARWQWWMETGARSHWWNTLGVAAVGRGDGKPAVQAGGLARKGSGSLGWTPRVGAAWCCCLSPFACALYGAARKALIELLRSSPKAFEPAIVTELSEENP